MNLTLQKFHTRLSLVEQKNYGTSIVGVFSRKIADIFEIAVGCHFKRYQSPVAGSGRRGDATIVVFVAIVNTRG